MDVLTVFLSKCKVAKSSKNPYKHGISVRC
nr:MAG TPA: hypothetical protein [Caudoviricetes sp.]